MARDEAYRRAEQKIEEARRSGAKELILSGMSLATIPQSIGQIPQLETLYLHSNRLTELSDSLTELINLQVLDVSFNQMNVLPDLLFRLTMLEELRVDCNQLATIPTLIRSLTKLRKLCLSRNKLTVVPEWFGHLTQLRSLDLSGNQLKALPESLGHLTQLQSLDLSENQLTALPESLGRLTQLQSLDLYWNQLTSLPQSIGRVTQLRSLRLGRESSQSPPQNNNLTDWPTSLALLENLTELNLTANPLSPELAAAYREGLDAIKRYLRAKSEGGQVVLNEAKLILIGEGEVGKSCLLGALRGDPWEEDRPTTHGIEIKPVKVTDPDSGTQIRLNGWDFGGQRVYRPTHQLFFSAPAVYLVVWKPREGPQQGFVKEWIKLVKHREPEAKILVVATHGGPKDRQPDIDRQEIWDFCGRETIIDFFHVDSQPPNKHPNTGKRTGDCKGIKELRDAIAKVAAGLPEMGRSFPRHWEEARRALNESADAYLPLDRVFAICKEYKLEEEDARLLLRICRRVGDLIHYEHDPVLHDIVILKPDWLATAMSFVLDDKQTRAGRGLVSFDRLGELWNDPDRAAKFRYEPKLHPLFLRLMERFDLSYTVSLPTDAADEIGFWQRMGSLYNRMPKSAAVPEIRYTSLIAQLVPDVRPKEEELNHAWAAKSGGGDEQQVQICRIVDARNGQSASAEGLFYQLIVRLHRFSLGRTNFKESVHWQRGLLLDDEYNGRALLEHIGNDVRITVRAAYPEKFLSVLTREVEWLVENFWEGLRCDVMVPCMEPCGRNAPGTGLFEVEKLIKSKRRREYPCPVCNEWQNIDCLLRNAPDARQRPMEALIEERFTELKLNLSTIRQELKMHDRKELLRFRKLNQNDQRILSEVDDAYVKLLRTLMDEAKEGPRLFSFEPVERAQFNPNNWVKKKFRLTLWCEHTRLPLPLLNRHYKEGVYDLELPREWFAQAAPFLKVLASTLSLVMPVAASVTKMAMDEAAYNTIEDQLGLGKECAEAMLKAGEKTLEWAGEGKAPADGPEFERGGMIRAQGGVLRQLQVWLKEKDAGFGGLVRVQNKRQEFLWVHSNFEKEY